MICNGFRIEGFQGDSIAIPVHVLCNGHAVDAKEYEASLVIDGSEDVFAGEINADGSCVVIRIPSNKTETMVTGISICRIVIECEQNKKSFVGSISICAVSNIMKGNALPSFFNIDNTEFFINTQTMIQVQNYWQEC